MKPYIEQVEAVNAAVLKGRGIIVAPTGFGKSVIIALIIQKLRVRTLIVVPTLELKRQLTASLSMIFVDRVVGGLEVNPFIAVENVDALNTKQEIDDYGCVIIDEFHHSGAKTYRDLNKKAWKNIYYRFGLTATPFRSNENERLLLESVLSQVIYRIDYQRAVGRGYIVPMEAYYVEVPPTQTTGYSWPEVYKELVVNNVLRNGLIRDILGKLEQADAPTLCLVKEIKHGLELQHLTGIPFANGQDESSRELITSFAIREQRMLIGTTGILGEGVDTKPCEYVVIAGLGKSKNAFMQQVGRAFRTWPGKESAKVIIFRDTSHKWSLTHFKAQCKILRDEYGIKPVKLEL